MDIAKRLEELRCMEFPSFDGTENLGLRSSSVIVAAEIIAEAIKEAAPSEEDTALLRKAANRVITFESEGERSRRQLREALNRFDAIVQAEQESKQEPQTVESKPESEDTEQG